MKRRPKKPERTPARTGPLSSDTYDIQYVRRHVEDDPAVSVPAQVAMKDWPVDIKARVRSVLIAVAAAPPLQFSGGATWKAMHGDMGGYFEVRCRSGKMLYRVFCILDPDPVVNVAGRRYGKNVLAIVAAGVKQNETAFTPAFYADVRAIGEEYKRQTPRCWA